MGFVENVQKLADEGKMKSTEDYKREQWLSKKVEAIVGELKEEIKKAASEGKNHFEKLFEYGDDPNDAIEDGAFLEREEFYDIFENGSYGADGWIRCNAYYYIPRDEQSELKKMIETLLEKEGFKDYSVYFSPMYESRGIFGEKDLGYSKLCIKISW